MSTPKTITLTIDVPACDMTPETIEQAVIEAATRQVLGIRTNILTDEDGNTYEEEVNDTLNAYRKRVEAEVSEHTKDLVACYGTKFVADIMESGFTPVDRYGNYGNPTTIRKSIADYARDWMEEKVDNQGRSNGYGNDKITRLHWLVRQEVERAFKQELSTMIAETAATIKPEIARQIREAVGSAINASLGVKS
jgi:hypothetical protein